MNNKLKTVKPEEIGDNFIKSIGHEWMLLTAGTSGSWNTMTAAWGGAGFLWQMPAAFSFVRFSRYTYEFMEASDYHSLSFFPKMNKAALQYCGTHSGRDVDKVRETGLIPMELDYKTVSFEQARLVLICRKLYRDDIKEEYFLDENIYKHYPKEADGSRDLHRMYIGEIIKAYQVML